MGLDACVYRSKVNLPFEPESIGAVLEAATGEYYFADPNLEAAREREFPADSRIAVKKRLGNVALVASLKETADRFLGSQSLVVSKVLYSGTHCGDCIPVQLIPQLESELMLLGRHAQACGDHNLIRFVVAMGELAKAAIREGNPIVF
jgi:hypothetical protein